MDTHYSVSGGVACPPNYDRLVDLNDDGVNKKIQYNDSHSDVVNT